MVVRLEDAMEQLTRGGEEELRITLATIGMGDFALADGSTIKFPPSMQLAFDFRGAFTSGAVAKVMCEDDSVIRHLEQELAKFRIKFRTEAR
jgi:hypothetical protein